MLSSEQKDQIFGYHMAGLSRDEIASSTQVSTGSVSNAIKEWKIKIGAGDIEEIRRFIKLSKKSGMTIKQSLEGFRMHELMNRLGVLNTEDSDHNENKFVKFVNEFYKVCHAHQITPDILASWFNDLVEFSVECWDEEENSKKITPLKREKETTIKNSSVPIMTLISRHIEKKKSEFDILKKKKDEIKKDIEFLNKKRGELQKNVTSLKQEKDHFLSLYDSFGELEYILKERCDIDITTELESVVNVFYGFNEQGYDLKRIYETYDTATALDWDIFQKKNSVESLQRQILSLQTRIKGNEVLLDASRKNWDTFTQLETMKFGLEELTLLWLIVKDIADNRGIASHDAVSVFIKDVEENYYEKTLFENRVAQKKQELETINNQLIVSRTALSNQPIIGASISQLYQNGITEQDIVDLVRIFQNSFQQTGLQEKTKAESYSNENSKTSGWKRLAEELKKYNGIKEAIRHSTLNLNKIKNEYAVLIKDFKGLSDLCQTASHLVNILNSYFFYFKGYSDQIHQNNSSSNNNNFNIIVNNVLVPFILLASHHYLENNKTEKEKEKEKEKENGSQDQDGNITKQ